MTKLSVEAAQKKIKERGWQVRDPRTGKLTKEYNTWMNMRMRCSNSNGTEFHRYGGRGITICEEWAEFSVFRTWWHEQLKTYQGEYFEISIDRINNDGNYCPSNCRLITRRENISRAAKGQDVSKRKRTKDGRFSKVSSKP